MPTGENERLMPPDAGVHDQSEGVPVGTVTDPQAYMG